jgi:transposase
MAHPKKLKKQVVEAYKNKEGTIRELAEKFEISRGTVGVWIKRYRESIRYGLFADDITGHSKAWFRQDPNRTKEQLYDWLQNHMAYPRWAIPELVEKIGWSFEKKKFV